MKSAYELAMERLNKNAPTAKLTQAQRAELAELDSIYAAKTAEREIALKAQMASAMTAGDYEKAQELEQTLARERRALQNDLEEKKERVRKQSSAHR